jgi:mono/diheme cytochrome c family protein
MLNRTRRSTGNVLLSLALLVMFVQPMRAQGNAEKNYKSKCMYCHAANGSGNSRNAKGVHDFRSPLVQDQSDAMLAEVISKGKNRMPRFGQVARQSKLTDVPLNGRSWTDLGSTSTASQSRNQSPTLKDAEIKDLVAYIRQLAKKN